MDWSGFVFSDFVESVLDRFQIADHYCVEKKRWGAAVAICDSPHGQMSLAIIDKGGFCSRHFHNQKVNVFNMIEGTLQLKVWDGQPKDIATVKADNVFAIESGMSYQIGVNIIHEMEARTNVVCMEAYYPTQANHIVSRADISRFTTGGLKPK